MEYKLKPMPGESKEKSKNTSQGMPGESKEKSKNTSQEMPGESEGGAVKWDELKGAFYAENDDQKKTGHSLNKVPQVIFTKNNLYNPSIEMIEIKTEKEKIPPSIFSNQLSLEYYLGILFKLNKRRSELNRYIESFEQKVNYYVLDEHMRVIEKFYSSMRGESKGSESIAPSLKEIYKGFGSVNDMTKRLITKRYEVLYSHQVAQLISGGELKCILPESLVSSSNEYLNDVLSAEELQLSALILHQGMCLSIGPGRRGLYQERFIAAFSPPDPDSLIDQPDFIKEDKNPIFYLAPKSIQYAVGAEFRDGCSYLSDLYFICLAINSGPADAAAKKKWDKMKEVYLNSPIMLEAARSIYGCDLIIKKTQDEVERKYNEEELNNIINPRYIKVKSGDSRQFFLDTHAYMHRTANMFFLMLQVSNRKTEADFLNGKVNIPGIGLGAFSFKRSKLDIELLYIKSFDRALDKYIILTKNQKIEEINLLNLPHCFYKKESAVKDKIISEFSRIKNKFKGKGITLNLKHQEGGTFSNSASHCAIAGDGGSHTGNEINNGGPSSDEELFLNILLSFLLQPDLRVLPQLDKIKGFKDWINAVLYQKRKVDAWRGWGQDDKDKKNDKPITVGDLREARLFVVDWLNKRSLLESKISQSESLELKISQIISLYLECEKYSDISTATNMVLKIGDIFKGVLKSNQEYSGLGPEFFQVNNKLNKVDILFSLFDNINTCFNKAKFRPGWAYKYFSNELLTCVLGKMNALQKINKLIDSYDRYSNCTWQFVVKGKMKDLIYQLINYDINSSLIEKVMQAINEKFPDESANPFDTLMSEMRGKLNEINQQSIHREIIVESHELKENRSESQGGCQIQ